MLKHVIDMGRPSWITVEIDDDRISKIYKEGARYFNDVQVDIQCDPRHADVFVTASKASVKYLKLRWNTVKLSKSAKFLGDEWERAYGYMGFRGMIPNRIMPWYFLMSEDNKTSGYGVMVQPSAMCFWQIDTSGVTLFLDLRNGGSGVALQGRKLKAATIIARSYENVSSFEAAQSFCRDMCPSPLLPDFPVYGSNNWYYAYGNSSEEEILSDTDYVLRVTHGTDNPPFMVIDDCWQEHHRLNEYNGGPWTRGNDKFPDMAGLAEKLREKGVRPGIWVRLLLNEDQKIPEEWRSPLNGCLDPTHPEALEYIKADVQRMCAWGYRLIKHDFSTFDLFNRWGFEMNPLVTEESKQGWHFHDRSKTNAEVVKMLYGAILKAARPYRAIILGCNTIGHLGAGLMHLNRVGDDTSGRNWERTRQIGINALAFRLPQHNTFYAIDADCVGIAGPVKWSFNKQWADLLAKSGTALFISAKPNLLNDHDEEELRQTLVSASKQDHHYVPIDWEETDCPEVWADGEHSVQYHWYEEGGLSFKYDAIRYQSYLSVVNQ
ncbi:hypothetical protein ABNN70_05385 [Sporolactobacillus sp. Y61]|uniref:Alpha-galactosidase n=1 Tax=Sporolactobacillus sp. Y61 TaxID=3160863 RepID=A0AAU8IH96_9BACL